MLLIISKIFQRIREYSAIIRDTTKTFRESGAVKEMAEAARDVAVAARDSTMDIGIRQRKLEIVAS